MLLVAGEAEVCTMLEHGYYWDIITISYLINESMYLVKGGRLGLMPRVLFHSCRPSFRHTGVMFLNLRSLRGWVIYGDPLDSSL